MVPIRDIVADMWSPRWFAFYEYIVERSNIYVKKSLDKAPAPWTDDPILREGKFGNIWRELDSGTQWELFKLSQSRDMLEHIRFICCYRHNLIPSTTLTLMAGGGWRDVLHAANGNPPMSDVIKIYPDLDTEQYSSINDTHKKMAVYAYDHWQDVIRSSDEMCWQIMSKESDPYFIHKVIQAHLPKLGEFKAYEVVTSFTYCEEWYPHTENSFVHVGHGAEPMLRYLIGDEDAKPNELCVYLVCLKEYIREKLNELGMKWVVPKWTLRTFEDCLCEYRKYNAVQQGLRDNRPYPDKLGRWSRP